MITPEELKAHLDMLKEAGVVGRVKIGDIEVTIAPAPLPQKDAAQARKSASKEYDAMLFAATEGIPDDEERT